MTSAFITLSGDRLSAGNARIHRSWQVLADGGLRAESLVIDGREWIRPLDAAGTTLPAPVQGRPVLTTRRERRWGVETEGLHGDLSIGAATWEITVFDDLPAVTLRLRGVAVATTAATATTAGPSGIEGDVAPTATASTGADVCERLDLVQHHARLRNLVLMDRTDLHDNLARVEERRLNPVETIRLAGCVFVLADPLSDAGLILVKHSPLPHARPAGPVVDLVAQHRRINLLGHGCGDTGEGYAWSVLGYAGGDTGCAAALHALQRCHRPYQPGRDGRLLSNTWGDRNRDGRISAAFIAEEITAGADLGVDVVQIDDGWQRGITSNSVHRDKGGVWLGFWAADPEFWAPHPGRFPDGLTGTASAVAGHGMAFGLWFAPDSADDFAHWRRDADQVLALHRDHGVRFVKIDGVKAHTKTAEANLQRFFRAVLAESAGSVTFDLDVTAETRPGYFGALSVGPLFIENRYTDWGRYWPHATLRNLWQLAWWIDPLRLRMEFLNPLRNEDRYGDDPLRPSRYAGDYLFATTCIANPLAWCEVSQLPSEIAASTAALIAVWRDHRERLHGGSILPIGECPDGASWTGFQSRHPDSLDLLVFRELNRREDCAFPLPEGPWTADVLYGPAEIGIAADHLAVRMAEPLSFTWIRLSRA